MKIDLSIRERMTLGFGLIIALVTLLIIIVVIKLEQLEKEKDYLIHVVAERVDQAHAIETAFLNESIALHSYLATRDLKYLKNYQQERLIRLQATGRLNELPQTERGDELFERLLTQTKAHETLADQILALIANGDSMPDLEAREQQLRALRTQVIEAAGEYYQLQGRRRQDAAARYDRIHGALITNIFLLTGVILLICLVAAALTIHSIRRPAQALLGAINALGRGDFAPARRQAESAMATSGAPRNELLVLAATFGRMAEVIRRREARLDAEGRVARAMTSTLEIQGLAAATLHEILAYATCECGAIYQAGARGQELRLLAHEGLAPPPETLPPDDATAGRAARERQTVVTQEPAETPLWARTATGDRPLAGMLAAPAIFQGETLGVILIGGAEKSCEDIQEFCERMARNLGASLSNALTHQATLQLSEELSLKSRQLELQNKLLLTQREQLEAQSEEIHAQNDELQRTLSHLKESEQELRRKTQALTDADRRKDEFLAMLAHELRNPLAAISNANYVLEQGVRGEEQAGRMRQIVTRQLRHLSRMVDDLLDVSRITRGKVSLRCEAVSLEQAVRHVVDSNRAQTNGQLNVQVDLPPQPVTLQADPIRLEQMIGALLNNAIKFSEPGGEIRVTVEPNGEWVTLRMSDHGSGIAPEVLPHIFELFAQAESGPDRAKGGLGIGLTLVKRLAELHGGSVEARSEGPGKGSEFILRLPLRR